MSYDDDDDGVAFRQNSCCQCYGTIRLVRFLEIIGIVLWVLSVPASAFDSDGSAANNHTFGHSAANAVDNVHLDDTGMISSSFRKIES